MGKNPTIDAFGVFGDNEITEWTVQTVLPLVGPVTVDLAPELTELKRAQAAGIAAQADRQTPAIELLPSEPSKVTTLAPEDMESRDLRNALRGYAKGQLQFTADKLNRRTLHRQAIGARAALEDLRRTEAQTRRIESGRGVDMSKPFDMEAHKARFKRKGGR